jgi:hypothetical protein
MSQQDYAKSILCNRTNQPPLHMQVQYVLLTVCKWCKDRRGLLFTSRSLVHCLTYSQPSKCIDEKINYYRSHDSSTNNSDSSNSSDDQHLLYGILCFKQFNSHKNLWAGTTILQKKTTGAPRRHVKLDFKQCNATWLKDIFLLKRQLQVLDASCGCMDMESPVKKD